MAIDLKNLDIKKAHESLVNKEFTALELTETYLAEIEKKNPALNAYLEVFNDAIETAKKVDEKIARGEEIGMLEGIPMSVKDVILIKDKKATGGSRILENYEAVYDATVISKLKKEGVIFLGKVNCDEFAMGGSGENSAFGPTKNPYDLSRVSGGSSSGSAAVVAGDLALASLGSDTGGSVRQPASFCGAVGLKPTYGTVSRYGLMAMASSLDQIGPITKTVDDAEIIFNAIKGKDKYDATSTDAPAVDMAVKKKIGVPRSFISKGIDPEVLANFNQTIEKLKSAGYEIVDVDLSLLKYALACYYIIMPAEASTNLARFDGLRYGSLQEGKSVAEEYEKTRGKGFGREVRRRIMLGTYVLSAGYYDAYYAKATRVRELIKEAYKKAFTEVDAVLTPTAPTPAFKIGEKTGDPLLMYLEDIFTVPANLAGIPAISVPSGFTSAGLPLGVQIAGPHFREDILFTIGKLI